MYLKLINIAVIKPLTQLGDHVTLDGV